MPTNLRNLQLFLKIGENRPKPAPAQVMTALSHVEVTNAIKEQENGFQMTFALGKQQAKDFALIQDEVFAPDTRVVIGVRFNGSSETLISGVVTHFQLIPSNEPGMATLWVTGRNITDMMDREPKDQPYPNLSDSGIVEQLMGNYAKYGLTLKQAESTKDTPHEQTLLPGQHGTDLQHIEELAKRNGFVFYTEPDSSGDVQAYWGAEKRKERLLPALSINLGPSTNLLSLSFGYNTQTSVKSRATQLDPESKQSNAIPPDSLDSKLAPLAEQSMTPQRTVILRDSAKYNSKRVGVAGSAAMRPNLSAVKGQGELDFVRYPHVLRAGNLVAVRGAGASYDGSYYIERVKHTLERGKYTQQFTLVREGLGALKQKGLPV